MSEPPTYGSHNPHPLSTLRTELVWEGKYDEYGNRREVDIAGCAMPMQRIESMDKPRRAAAATGQLELFEQQNPKQDDFRNRLVWGDNKLVMASLLDGIDSMFTREEVKQVAKATAQAGGHECYCWEFEMDLHLLVNSLVPELGVKLKLVQILREIMEKNRKAPPPFLEVAVLTAEAVYRSPHPLTSSPCLGEGGQGAVSPFSRSGRGAGGEGLPTVDLKLTQFLPSLTGVPSKELEASKERAIKSGFDFIDFWAVDFNWQPGKPFTHDWQDYHTRKDRSLKTISDAGYVYPAPGKYTTCVKVVDTFGCDASITVEIDV